MVHCDWAGIFNGRYWVLAISCDSPLWGMSRQFCRKWRCSSSSWTSCRVRARWCNADVLVIWTTCIMVAMVWSWDLSKPLAYLVYASLIFSATSITVIYIRIKDPVFHQVAYAVLTALVLLPSIYLMLTRVSNTEAKKNMIWTIFIGVTTFLMGFGLWIIDNECCDALRYVRDRIGLPWAFFFGTPFPVFTHTVELHGWWWDSSSRSRDADRLGIS